MPWVGEHVIHLSQPITVFPNGSGDTTYNYVEVLTKFAMAVAVALVWSIVDFRRAAYPRLHDWLRIYTRYMLALIMLGYGLAKVLPTQFPFPSDDRLLQPFGQASPMGLLWTFMGYSPAYNIYAGLGKVIGGILLFWRRTTTLGAMILVAVLANIIMLNFCYDVPVKLYSTHLLLFACFLLLPDAQRLLNVLLLNRTASAVVLGKPFVRRGLNIAATVVKVLFITTHLGLAVYAAISLHQQFGDTSQRPTLYGLYEVEEFTRDGEIIPPLITEPNRWRRVSLTFYRQFSMASIWTMVDERERYMLTDQPETKTLLLQSRMNPNISISFHYEQPDKDHLVLEGTTIKQNSIRAKLHRMPASSFPLVNRGFHWINEYPFNQ